VDVADILTIVLAMINGAFTFNQIGSNIQAFPAVAASSNIYATINRISSLGPSSARGDIPWEVKGEIRFTELKHIYPSSEDVVVLENCNLHIEAGKLTAIVGGRDVGKAP
jgi:ATP-binding cassette subfamily B (MDR/TAP) protein 1